MYMNFGQSRRSAKSPSRPSSPIVLGPWPLGINKALSLSEISIKELAEAVNFKYNQAGGLEIRQGLTRYTAGSALTNPVGHMTYFPYTPPEGAWALFYDTADTIWLNTTQVLWIDESPPSSQSDELIVTNNDFKLWYIDAYSTPSLLATLSSETIILPYGGYALLLDGGSVKLYNKLTGVISMAYDDGTGAHAYQVNETDLTSDSQTKLYTGSKTEVGIKFTTQDWDSGYTITITQVKAYLSRLGSPTGNVGCKLYNSSGVAQATSGTTVVSGTIDTTAELITFEFTSGAMARNTEYWAVITYSGGDVSNCVQVECDTVATTGVLKYYDGTWHDDTTKIPLMGVKPGKAPKASFGITHNNRAYLGGDSDNPGWMWYTNVTGPFDYSTADGGGYIGAVDDNQMNYPVGAIISIYNDIYVFGRSGQPYIAKLTGASPSVYALQPIFQKSYATHKTTINVINDIWFCNASGIDNIGGVQEYGDLRTYSISDPVKNLMDQYWDDSRPFACYNSMDGQYILKLPGYPRCLVAHTKKPIQGEDGHVRYPFTEYVFIRNVLTSSSYRWIKSGSGTNEYYVQTSGGGDPSISKPAYLMMDDSLLTEGTAGSLSDHGWDYGDNDSLGYSTIYVRDNSADPDTSGVEIKTLFDPTAFACYKNDFFVCMDDGYIYKLDNAVTKDNSQDVSYALGLSLIKLPFSEVCLDRYHLMAESDGSASVQLQIIDQGKRLDQLASQLPLSGKPDIAVTVSDSAEQQGDINWNATRFMAYLREIDPNDVSLRVSGIRLETSVLSK